MDTEAINVFGVLVMLTGWAFGVAIIFGIAEFVHNTTKRRKP